MADADLAQFVERVTAQVVRNGDLEGLGLAGLGPKGIELLQNYVDRSGDVQTGRFSVCKYSVQWCGAV